MHVRIKITLLFTLIMCVILGILCGFIYSFFYTTRLENIKAHLINRALTTANILNDPATFSPALMKKIDSITIIPMENKTVQAYNSHNEIVYARSDLPNDTLHITNDILNKARTDKKYFFTAG